MVMILKRKITQTHAHKNHNHHKKSFLRDAVWYRDRIEGKARGQVRSSQAGAPGFRPLATKWGHVLGVLEPDAQKGMLG